MAEVRGLAIVALLLCVGCERTGPQAHYFHRERPKPRFTEKPIGIAVDCPWGWFPDDTEVMDEFKDRDDLIRMIHRMTCRKMTPYESSTISRERMSGYEGEFHEWVFDWRNYDWSKHGEGSHR